MTVTINLKPDTEAFIKKQAERQGLSVEAYINTVIETLSALLEGKRDLTSEEWSREFRAWAASHPKEIVIADDSRDSIYEGNGE